MHLFGCETHIFAKAATRVGMSGILPGHPNKPMSRSTILKFQNSLLPLESLEPGKQLDPNIVINTTNSNAA